MHNIDSIITRHFERRDKDKVHPYRKRSGKVSASKLHLAVGCDTKEELKKYLAGEVQTFSKRQERIFDLGHNIEDLVLLDMGESHKFSISNQQRLLENYFLKGYIDCTIHDNEKNKTYIADVKSMNDSNYSQFIRGIVPHYIQVQMMCYIYLWKSTVDLPIEDEAVVVSYNKNDSRVKALLIKYDEKFINAFIKEAENVFLTFKGVTT